MAYNDLTANEKLAVQELAQFVRASVGELARLASKGRAIANYYSGNVEVILSELASSDLIPNESDLAGAQDLTKEQLVNLTGYLMTFSDMTDGANGSYNTNYHRGLYARAAGPTNIV